MKAPSRVRAPSPLSPPAALWQRDRSARRSFPSRGCWDATLGLHRLLAAAPRDTTEGPPHPTAGTSRAARSVRAQKSSGHRTTAAAGSRPRLSSPPDAAPPSSETAESPQLPRSNRPPSRPRPRRRPSRPRSWHFPLAPAAAPQPPGPAPLTHGWRGGAAAAPAAPWGPRASSRPARRCRSPAPRAPPAAGRPPPDCSSRLSRYYGPASLVSERGLSLLQVGDSLHYVYKYEKCSVLKNRNQRPWGFFPQTPQHSILIRNVNK